MGKKTLIGVRRSFSYSNLLVNDGLFLNQTAVDNWSLLNSSVASKSLYSSGYSGSCVKFEITSPSTTSNSTTQIQHTVSFTSGHIYYASLRYKGLSTNSTYLYPKLLLHGDSVGFFGTVTGDSKKTTWTKMSVYGTANADSGSIIIRQSYGSTNTTYPITAGMYMLYDYVALIDLTAIFGAGNEPTQEWCDANVYYNTYYLDNVASNVKNIGIGICDYAQHNLIENNLFLHSTSGWTVKSDATMVRTSNLSYFYMRIVPSITSTSTTVYRACDIDEPIDVIGGHIYYYGCKARLGNTNYTTTFNLYFAQTSVSIPSSTTESIVSNRITASSNITNNENKKIAITMKTPTSGNVAYFTNFCLYDLTAIFGSGNEPTKEWCDANLYEIAHKVKKGYIGVNGVARQFYSSSNWDGTFIEMTGTSTGTTSGYKLYEVAYGNDRFVAVGNSQNYCLYSTNGTSWNKGSGITSSVYAVCYGNGMFVAAGYRKYGYYSTDGVSWKSFNFQLSDSTTTVRGVTYGNNIFVAACLDGEIHMSSDGITWEYITTLDIKFAAITYGNGRFVAVGWYGSCYYSDDGRTWIKSDTGTTYDFYSITYGDGVFVAVGTYTIKYSTDGITWKSSNTSASDYNIYCIAYGDGRFVAGGSNSYIFTSTDGGKIWDISQKTNIPTSYTFSDIVWGEDRFVIVCDRGRSYYALS